LKDGFWIIYPLFIMVQIPHAAVVAWFRQRLDHGAKTLALLSIGLLLVIPTYSVGLNNDFAMRASIVPLALLAFVFGSIVAELQFSDGIKRISAPIAIVVLGSIAPAFEIQRALVLDSFAISDCNLLTTWSHLEPDRWWSNYFAKSDSMPTGLLRYDQARFTAGIEERQCWPGHPFQDAQRTVWREPGQW
jgi:hypothetical protein